MGMTRLARIKKEITRLDPNLKEGEHGYITYLILLSSIVVGPNIKKIAKFAHIPRESVRERSVNLRQNGVWKQGKVYAEWFEKDGGIAFVCDSMVADGLLKRS